MLTIIRPIHRINGFEQMDAEPQLLPAHVAERALGLSTYMLRRAIDSGAVPVRAQLIGHRLYINAADWRQYSAALAAPMTRKQHAIHSAV